MDMHGLTNRDDRDRRDSRDRDEDRDDDRDRRRRSRSPRRDEDREEAKNAGNNLYVSNLSYKTTGSDLERMFEKFGKVVDCRLVTDPRTHESRGFGFVTMDTSDSADEAVRKLDRTEVDGRNITVEKARRNRPHEPTPGRYLGPPQASVKYAAGPDRSRDRGHDRGYERDSYRGGGYGRRSPPRYDPYSRRRSRSRSPSYSRRY
mmetsp:Transcript_26008/g.42650  ORF Transcript_26008/g.42650 Transcript_26008/m.42650 type:complete len:204 (-) Transcript_26008:257-868(-)